MTDTADMTGHFPHLSGCGCGERGGRTRTWVLDHVRVSAPDRAQVIENELSHNWQASHPRQHRRDSGDKQRLALSQPVARLAANNRIRDLDHGGHS
jgi:hypothetical protein